MDLTPELKKRIDAMPYESMLSQVRFAPVGAGMFQGESGVYFMDRMAELRKQGADHVGASKHIGWGGK